MVTEYEICPICGMSFYYDIMLVDDQGILRVFGEILDKCQCGNCLDCCRRKVMYQIPEIQSSDFCRKSSEIRFTSPAQSPGLSCL